MLPESPFERTRSWPCGRCQFRSAPFLLPVLRKDNGAVIRRWACGGGGTGLSSRPGAGGDDAKEEAEEGKVHESLDDTSRGSSPPSGSGSPPSPPPFSLLHLLRPPHSPGRSRVGSFAPPLHLPRWGLPPGPLGGLPYEHSSWGLSRIWKAIVTRCRSLAKVRFHSLVFNLPREGATLSLVAVLCRSSSPPRALPRSELRAWDPPTEEVIPEASSTGCSMTLAAVTLPRSCERAQS